MSAAAQAIQKFRLHELKGLKSHILRHGPLPPSSTSDAVRLPNPFLAHRNPNTGRWAPPKYSLRRQADLIKKAKASNTLELLPPGPKLHDPAALTRTLNYKSLKSEGEAVDEMMRFPVDWVGNFEPKKAKGSELGIPLYAGKKRMFKGHKWERMNERRVNHKRMLLKDMDKRVRRYKALHQKRKPHPLKPPRSTSTKLPF